MTRHRSAPGGTGRPRSKTSTTITVTHEHVPRWVEAAKRAGLTPPQYVISMLDGEAVAWNEAFAAGYQRALADARYELAHLEARSPKPTPLPQPQRTDE